MARVNILGGGWIRNVTSRGLKELDDEVMFYDLDNERVQELRESGLDATDSLEDVVEFSDIPFIYISTPTEDGKIDLDNLKS